MSRLHDTARASAGSLGGQVLEIGSVLGRLSVDVYRRCAISFNISAAVMCPMIFARGLLAPFWGKIRNPGSSVVGSPRSVMSSSLAAFVLYSLLPLCRRRGIFLMMFCFAPGFPLLLAWVGFLGFYYYCFLHVGI